MSRSLFSIKLKDLLSGIAECETADVIISGMNVDSREIQKGDLFIALTGETNDGAAFITDAINNGAVAVLINSSSKQVVDMPGVDGDIKATVPVIEINDLREQAGLIADRFYQHPSRQLRVYGVTGTNGKTSCSHFIAQMLSQDNKCGLLGTLGSGLYSELVETGYTTPDVISCHKWLAEVKAKKADFAVMEVSSHALVQHRVDGILFDTAVFTNLSQEHLDFHGDMESYANAKMKLFEFSGLKHAVVNTDDATGRELIKKISGNVNCISYGIEKEYNPDVCAEDIMLNRDGISMTVITSAGKRQVSVPLIGKFNVSNILATLSVMLVSGIDFDTAVNQLQKIKSVAGRMQSFIADTFPMVVVDFAHTPDALEQALIALKEHTKNELWCVFGCGGDRDSGKRPIMGGISEKYSDWVVLTNDNPRTEDYKKIIKDIQLGMKNPERAYVEYDRKSAIDYALANAKSDDVVLIAGKGHERYQQIQNEKIPFSDIEIVSEALGACA